MSSSKRFPRRERLAVFYNAGLLVRTETLPGSDLPLVITPGEISIDLAAWAADNKEQISSYLTRHGAILFRGFGLSDAVEFERMISVVSDGSLPYQERSSPRTQVNGNIYTSTDYPPDHSIFLHNEQSYNSTFPSKIFFFCVTPAAQGGATPLADCRRVLQRIPAEIALRFMERKIQYVRNFGNGLGLSWQIAFQTADPAQVEAYCEGNDIDLEWKRDGGLRVRSIRPAVVRHPRSGEQAWFNHCTFFHISTLQAVIGETLAHHMAESELPTNTYYGDGSPIEADVLNKLREAYRAEMTRFEWKAGDLLLLDNMLTAHGRDPFTPPRKILVGMADPLKWDAAKELEGIDHGRHEC